MNAGDVAGDGETKAGRLRVLIAGVVEPIKGPEHLIALILRDAWSVVLDLDHQRAVLPPGAHCHMVGEAYGVVDEIGDGALEGMTPERHHQRRVADIDANVGLAMRLVAYLGEDLAYVGANDLLAGGALSKGDIILEHGLHLVDIGAHGV